MEFDSSIIVGALALLGTMFGTLAGIASSSKMTVYRIEQLEQKVDKHNNVIERQFSLEGRFDTLQAEIDDVKRDVDILKTT